MDGHANVQRRVRAGGRWSTTIVVTLMDHPMPAIAVSALFLVVFATIAMAAMGDQS